MFSRVACLWLMWRCLQQWHQSARELLKVVWHWKRLKFLLPLQLLNTTRFMAALHCKMWSFRLQLYLSMKAASKVVHHWKKSASLQPSTQLEDWLSAAAHLSCTSLLLIWAQLTITLSMNAELWSKLRFLLLWTQSASMHLKIAHHWKKFHCRQLWVFCCQKELKLKKYNLDYLNIFLFNSSFCMFRFKIIFIMIFKQMKQIN